MPPLSGHIGSRRGRGWSRLVCSAGLSLLLAGCQGTGFGEGLSRSFSTPTPSPPEAATTAPPAPSTAAGPDTPTAGGKSSDSTGSGAPPPTGEEKTPSSATGPVARPSPYRLILRLPLADPAAPAEVVTRALRAAGVPFEVETIERMAGPEAPSGNSTPATGAAPAPSGRPAPEPSP